MKKNNSTNSINNLRNLIPYDEYEKIIQKEEEIRMEIIKIFEKKFLNSISSNINILKD